MSDSDTMGDIFRAHQKERQAKRASNRQSGPEVLRAAGIQFQTKAVGATLLTGIACCVAVLLGVNALPALAGTAALFCVVTTWGGTR